MFNNGDAHDDESEGDENEEKDDLENHNAESQDTDEHCSKIPDSCAWFLAHDSFIACYFVLLLAALIAISKSILKYLLLLLNLLFSYSLSKDVPRTFLAL